MSLKTEAENIVAYLKLLDYLQQFGKVGIAGSVALDLIVKPDIDVHVLAKTMIYFKSLIPFIVICWISRKFRRLIFVIIVTVMA